ncbi:MAG: hypothetical protein AAB571_09350 [Chloroflexota bacterium]
MLKIDLPQKLQQEFERAAQALYTKDSIRHALIEAVELWLSQHAEVKAQATANDDAFERLVPELEKKYMGKWVVIAEGKLQGVGDSLAEVDHLAIASKDRIVMPIGLRRPATVEVGWQMAFT